MSASPLSKGKDVKKNGALMLSVIILTFNSSASIRRTLSALQRLEAGVFVVDSFSTDDTIEICQANRCHVVQRAFVNYADQRNWAIEKFNSVSDWQLHVDADEELDDTLLASIKALDLANSKYDGFIVVRRIVFMNKILQFGGISKTWHMRLFRSSKGRVEDRLYDQHFICDGPTKILEGSMLDYQEMSLSQWTKRHNRWSDFEADEIGLNRELETTQKNKNERINPRIGGTVIERKRFQKSMYYRLPLFIRPLLYFIFRFVALGGFMDGTRGLIYHTLQGFWFRFLVDAKLYERAHCVLGDPKETTKE